VLLDQHWNFSRLRYPICLLSRTGREMLTFVRSMMEWLGGTISKEDVGEEGGNSRQNQNNRRRRDEDGDEDALGAFALRFKYDISYTFVFNILTSNQTSRVFPQSSSTFTNIFLQRPKTNSCCPCLLISRPIQTPLLRLRRRS